MNRTHISFPEYIHAFLFCGERHFLLNGAHYKKGLHNGN